MSEPKRVVIDTKLADTTGDQVARIMLRGLNWLWCTILVFAILPLGIAWAIGSVAFMMWNTNRRNRRYSNNAIALANLNRGWGA